MPIAMKRTIGIKEKIGFPRPDKWVGVVCSDQKAKSGKVITDNRWQTFESSGGVSPISHWFSS